MQKIQIVNAVGEHMSNQNIPCSKQDTPFIKWSNPTTNNITTTKEPDFFIIPQSGVNCRYKKIKASIEVKNVLDK